MGDHDDAVTRTSVSESTTVSVTVHRDDETLIENMGCEGQIERSSCEGDGGEIMVEVVGSDVFVDGISGHDDELGKEGLEREIAGFDGGGSGIGDLVSREVGGSSDQVWDGRPGAGAGGFQVIPRSSGQQSGDVAVDVGVVVGSSTEEPQVVVEDEVMERVKEAENERGLVEKGVEGVIVSVHGAVMDDEVSNSGVEASVESYSVLAGSSSAQTQAVVENNAVVVNEEGMNRKDEMVAGDVIEVTLLLSENGRSSEVEMGDVGTDKDSSIHENAEFLDQRTENVGEEDGGVTNGEEDMNHKDEMRAGDVMEATLPLPKNGRSSEVEVGDVGADKDSSIHENAEFLDQRTENVGEEDGGVTNGEEDMNHKDEMRAGDVMEATLPLPKNCEVGDVGADKDSSIHENAEFLDQRTEVVSGEDGGVTNGEEGMNPKDEMGAHDVLEASLPVSENDRSSEVEMGDVGTEKDSSIHENAEFLDQRPEVVGGEDGGVTNGEEGMNCKDEMGTGDVMEGTLPLPENGRSSEVEMGDVGTDKDSSVHENTEFLDQRTEVFGGEDGGVTNGEEGMNHQDEMRAGDVMETTLPLSENGRSSEVEMGGVGTDKDSSIHENAEFLDQQTEVVGGEDGGITDGEEGMNRKEEMSASDVMEATLPLLENGRSSEVEVGDGGADNDSSIHENAEFLDQRTEVVNGEDGGVTNGEEGMNPKDEMGVRDVLEATLPVSENDRSSEVEMGDVGTDKDSSIHENAEFLDQRPEVVGREDGGVTNGEEGMNHKDEMGACDVMEATLPLPENGRSSEVEIGDVGTDRDSSVHENAEFLDQQTEVFGGEDCGVTKGEEGMNHQDEMGAGDVMEATLPLSENGRSSEVEMGDVGTEKDSSIHENSEFLDQRTEVVGGEDDGITFGEDILHSTAEVLKTDFSDQAIACSVDDPQMKVETAGESAASDDNLNVDSLSSHEPTTAAVSGEVGAVDDMVSSNPDVDATKNASLGGIGKDVGKVGIVHTESGSFIEQSQVAVGYPVVTDCQVSVLDSGTQFCGGEEVLTTENTEVGGSAKNSGYVEDERFEAMVENSVIDDAMGDEPESSNVQTQTINDSEVKVMDGKVSSPKLDVPITGGMDGIIPCSEDLPKVKCVITCESARMDGFVCENPCVTQRREDAGMDIEEVFDFKGEVPRFDALEENLGCSGKDQHLNFEKVDGSSENDVAHGHLESSGELTRIADSGEVAVIDEGIVPTFEAEAEMKDGQAIFDKLDCLNGDLYLSEVDENLKAATEFGCAGDVGFVQADSETYVGHNLVAEGETSVMNEKIVSNSKTEDLDGDTWLQRDEKLNTLTVVGSTEKVVGFAQVNTSSTGGQTEGEIQVKFSAAEFQGIVEAPTSDAMDGNISLSANENKLKVETVDKDKVDDSVVGKDIPLGAEVGDHVTPILGTNSDSLQERTCIQDGKQEAVPLLAEIPIHEVDQDQNINPLNIDEMSNQETGIMAISDTVVEATAGSQARAHECSHREGDPVSSSASDFAIPVPDGNQTLEAHVLSDNKSCLDGEQSTDTSISDIVTSGEVLNKAIAAKDESCMTNDNHIMHPPVSDRKVSNSGQEEVDNQHPDGEDVDSHREQEIDIEEHDTETDWSNAEKETTLEAGSSVGEHQSNYLLPPENEGEFSVSDLVWGKVKSHPWWPGQIFDPADASEKAIKYHKKDCFLVAYFGDHTFAWNDASLLKPFWSHFSQIEKQSNSEAFQNAVRCAVEEISRRVELGLACSCMPQDAYDQIEYQIVDNTGIRQESSRRSGVDKSSRASSFELDKLVEYIRALAQSPSGVFDRLGLVIAKAQLSAFCSFKRYRQLPEFQFCGGLLESDAAAPQLSEMVENTSPVFREVDDSSHKRKLNLEDIMCSRKKERSLSELMGDGTYSPEGEDCPDGKVMSSLVSPSGRKRKSTDSFSEGSDKRVNFYAAKVSTAASPIPKPSFKVGECIRRVASQLTGSPSILSPHTPENFQREIISAECSSLDEMLSQLQLAARDPMKGYSFLNTICTFFSGFRSSVVLNQYAGTKNSSTGRPGSGRKKKASRTVIGSPEEFEFDDENDSYWTDRIIQNYSDEQPLYNGENGGREYPLVAFEPDKSLASRPRSHSKKRYSTANNEMPAEEPTEYMDDSKRALSPAELIMSFPVGNPVPSLMYLNKTFRRFGPLMESETEVDGATGRARLVFKRVSDAEVAFSSAGTFSIFGSLLVHYQLNYSPSIAYKPLPLAISEGQEDANMMSLI